MNEWEVVVARYLLVMVDENDRAEKLRHKLDEVEGIDVIGVFWKPTQFCNCENYEGRSPRGKKYGWNIHTACGRPRPGNRQAPNNLMFLNVPSRFQNISLSIKEPYQSPYEEYGPKVIAAKMQQIEENARKLKRRRLRRPRARR